MKITKNGFVNFIRVLFIFGPRHLTLFACKKWDSFKLPLRLPVFGLITHREELLNIRDNMLKGAIRDGYIEKQIGKSTHPVIVDCGINVGITVRWWFYVNPGATVFGIDMMQEASDFSRDALPERHKSNYVSITAALDNGSGRVLNVKFDDPLFGGNSLKSTDKYLENRQMTSITLDDCLSCHNIREIDLLKVDIENTAATMLEGAAITLAKTKNILLEIHSDEERVDSIALLSKKGFYVRQSFNRQIWFEKKTKVATDEIK